MRKSSREIEQKIAELCAIDATKPPEGIPEPVFVGNKVGAIKALLWALGVNDDDKFHVPAQPGVPINMKSRSTL